MATLSLKQIHALCANTETPVDPETCPGLIVQVSRAGHQTWAYRYRTNGMLRRMRLGLVPETQIAKPHEMTLAQARAKYYEARAERERTGDPLAQRREAKRQRAQEAQDRSLTVQVAVRAYLEALGPRLAKRTRDEYQRQFDKNIVPSLGASTPLSAVTTEKLRDKVLAPLERRGLTVGLNRTIATLKAWLHWCEDRYGVENAARRLRIDRRVERPCDRTLTESEIVAFWRATDVPDDRIAQCLRSMLLTALRPGEAGSLDWQWIESDRLTIPKTKNGRAHSLPLSAQAQAVLDTQRPDGQEKPTGPVFGLRSDVLAQRVQRMLGLSHDQQKRKKESKAAQEPRHVPRIECEPFTPHDLRRTALTILARLGCPLQVIQKIANHAPSGVTQQVYLRHGFEREAREWLDKLGAYVEGLASGQVVSIGSARREEAA
jgi:integrase